MHSRHLLAAGLKSSFHIGTAFCLSLLVAAPSLAQTPSVDELVAKNIAARGGLEKLQAINSSKITGTVSTQGMDIPITVLTKRPNKMRQDLTMQGQSIVQAFDGTTVWAMNPMMGPGAQPVEGPQADALKSRALFDGPLVGFKERGDTLEVVGQADVEGVKTWKLKLANKEGRAMHIFLDAETGLEKQMSATMEQNGMTMEFDTILSDYQPADGVPVARSMKTLMGGQPVAAVTITSVEYNVPIEDSVFVMPAK
jgi:outer membrane lipoprotein-sorting protein